MLCFVVCPSKGDRLMTDDPTKDLTDSVMLKLILQRLDRLEAAAEDRTKETRPRNWSEGRIEMRRRASSEVCDGLGATRTRDLPLRRRSLYPPELQALKTLTIIITPRRLAQAQCVLVVFPHLYVISRVPRFQKRFKGRPQIRILEMVAGIQGDLRDDALAGGHDFGHLSHQSAERESGDGKESRAVQRGGQFPGELLVGHYAGSGSIDRAVHSRRHQRVQKNPHDVLDVNPREPLPPTAQTPAEPEFEGQ